MELENFSSKLLKEAVDEFAKLPGIGRKTALRLVLHLLNREKEEVNQFGNTIIKLRSEIKRCKSCNVISDNELCPICSDSNRDHSLVCVVENSRDVMAIESTHQYQVIYPVLTDINTALNTLALRDVLPD